MLKFDAKKFLSELKFVFDAADKEPNYRYPGLQGVLIAAMNQNLLIIATDGVRMNVSEFSGLWHEKSEDFESLWLSAKTVEDLLKKAKASEQIEFIGTSENLSIFPNNEKLPTSHWEVNQELSEVPRFPANWQEISHGQFHDSYTVMATGTVDTWNELLCETNKVKISFSPSLASVDHLKAIKGIKITDLANRPVEKELNVICDPSQITRFCKFISKKDLHDDMILKQLWRHQSDLPTIQLEFRGRKSIFLSKR
jgi:hypothetical protein